MHYKYTLKGVSKVCLAVYRIAHERVVHMHSKNTHQANENVYSNKTNIKTNNIMMIMIKLIN